MSANRSSFEKRQRDRNKKAKAAAKREKRLGRGPEDSTPEVDTTTMGEQQGRVTDAPIKPDELLRMVAAIHDDYDAGRIDLDEFEERKADLLSRLPVD
ncbi:MAG: hypothetical protein OEY23_17195 [Acidimicrobiia bacterium]|nr:hypothetical protein [Acidimicrobiia bacterium]